MKLLLAVAALGLAFGCSASSGEESSDSSVDWSQYAPGVKDRIDRAADQGKCPALQREFDNATAADLLTYIDEKMKGADCY